MTTLSGTCKALLPERVKRPLRRCPGVLSPVKLLRTALYHAGLYRLSGHKVAGLHLGCGDLVIPGFWNVDAMFTAKCDLMAAVERIKLADNTVGTIYCAHVFEHLSRAAAPQALQQWYRVLKPGGTLYLACPDLEALARLYLTNLPRYDTAEGRHLVDRVVGIIYGGQHNRFNYHYSGWSFATLQRALEAVGFHSVRHFDSERVSFRPFKDASLARPDGVLVSLNVQATK